MYAVAVELLLETGRYRVKMPYGCATFENGHGFIFCAVPQRGCGVQWHRDIIPALKRCIRRLTATPFREAVTGIDGYEQAESVELLRDRMRGRNQHLWFCFRDGEFEQVVFPD